MQSLLRWIIKVIKSYRIEYLLHTKLLDLLRSVETECHSCEPIVYRVLVKLHEL